MATGKCSPNGDEVEKEKSRFPLQQGGLDFLCGVYAAINAMHLRNEITLVDQAAIPFRLGLMFMQSQNNWDLAQAVCYGVGEQDFGQLLKQMSWRDWDHFTTSNALEMEEKVKCLLGRNTASIIVSLISTCAKEFDPDHERDVVHYTVVTGLGENGFAIFDSQGVEEIEKQKGKLYYDCDRVKIGYVYWMKHAKCAKT